MRARGVLLSAALAFLVLLAFSGVRENGYLPYDDDTYVTGNPAVLDGVTGRGVRWAFSSVGYAANWHPLTWLSHMADVQLFGLDPRGHHLTSLALYTAGCLLLFRVLAAATGHHWRSFLAAALFAVHPLRVESVAWVAERKDVLGFLLGMLTMAAWVAWLRRPRPWWRFAPVAGAYVAALLAKATLVVLPPLLLLLAWWPLGALRPHVARAPRRVPFPIIGSVLLMVPALAAALVALMAQRSGGGLLRESAPAFGARLANAVVSLAAYLGSVLYPQDLAVFYPLPAALPAGAVAAAALLAAGVGAAAVHVRRRHPWLLTGWLWYLAALLPLLGLIPVGAQARADRYALFPSIGLAVAGVWAVAGLGRSRWAGRAAVAGGTALVFALIGATRAQVAVWRDGETLFAHALRVTRGNWHIEHEYGVLLLNAKRHLEAERHLREASRLRPDHVMAHYNLAGALFWQGRAAEAADEYRQAVRLRPDFAEGRYRLGRALAYLGRTSEALAEYEATLRLEPGHAAAAEGRRRVLSGGMPAR